MTDCCRDEVLRRALAAGSGPEVLLFPDHTCNWWMVVVCEHGTGYWVHPPAEVVERMEEPW